MKKIFLTLLLIVGCSRENDQPLERVIKHYDLKPLPVRKFESDPKYLLGQALFFDNVLSGNRDVSCATCHLWNRGSSDALSVSIGTHGFELGEDRYIKDGFEIEHPRNSLDLWNRDNNSVKALFWDGRVEMMDPERRIFRTPMGDYLPKGLDNTLAVQAIFPLTRADEMLGRYGDNSPDYLPESHANKTNEYVTQESYRSDQERIESAHRMIIKRIIGDTEQEEWQKRYLEMFEEAYPNVAKEDYSVVHIANALAHYEELAFATRQTPWDDYLAGNKSAISKSAKKGAVIFYTSGKCASCHSGPLMSDFNYHNLGIPDFGPGMDGTGKDYGRYAVTGNNNDRYRFRTPPLRNVNETAPYFHNGFIQTLEGAIRHHMDIDYYSDKYRDDGGFMMRKDQIISITPILKGGLDLSDEDVQDLISFMKSLTSSLDRETFDRVMPEDVPSGIPIHRLKEETKYLLD